MKRAALKGEDAHLVAVLVRLCRTEGLKFDFHLACIDHARQGIAEDLYGEEWAGEEGWTVPYEGEGEDAFTLVEFCGTETDIKSLVTLDGTVVDPRAFKLKEENFVPKAVFKDVDPDFTRYGGYMGNVRGVASLNPLFCSS